jgi:hypothetical protein
VVGARGKYLSGKHVNETIIRMGKELFYFNYQESIAKYSWGKYKRVSRPAPRAPHLAPRATA